MDRVDYGMILGFVHLSPLYSDLDLSEIPDPDARFRKGSPMPQKCHWLCFLQFGELLAVGTMCGARKNPGLLAAYCSLTEVTVGHLVCINCKQGRVNILKVVH